MTRHSYDRRRLHGTPTSVRVADENEAAGAADASRAVSWTELQNANGSCGSERSRVGSPAEMPIAGNFQANQCPAGYCGVPKWHSNPIADRVRRKRQRLPSSLLIENAPGSDTGRRPSHGAPRRFRSRLATIRPERPNPLRDWPSYRVCWWEGLLLTGCKRSFHEPG